MSDALLLELLDLGIDLVKLLLDKLGLLHKRGKLLLTHSSRIRPHATAVAHRA